MGHHWPNEIQCGDARYPWLVANTLSQLRRRSTGVLVFPNGAGNPEPPPNIYQGCWQPLQAKCGFKSQYCFPMLRHAAVSMFIQYLGWTPKRLQTVMGHSSITMTFDLYGHLLEDTERDREDMAKIEAV
jgi:integrase